MKKPAKTAVAYLRVSTKGQALTGLGIDAQREAVATYCKANGLDVIAEFVEIESGRNTFRPGLADAIAKARGTRSLLVIARLDRLSRSPRFIAELLESVESGELKFVCCDIPSANELVLHILAAVAKEEAKACSARTKLALAAAKARGKVLGSRVNLGPPAIAGRRGGRASAITRRHKRDKNLSTVASRIRYLRDVEGYGYKAIASVLNEEHYKTTLGNRWRADAVWRALRRLKERGSASASI